jgi:hypothetical protein
MPVRVNFLQLLIFIFAAGALQAQQIEPPQNPFLADSPWPMTHVNSYCQASSSLPGPTPCDRLNVKFQQAEPVAVTLSYGPLDQNGNRAIWGNTIRFIFKIDSNGKKWEYAARQKRKQGIPDSASGAYSLVDCDGVFFVPRGKKIEAYCDACRGNSLSGICKAGEYEIPACQLRSSEEEIVGMNMTYDGWLTFVTDYGTVGVVSRDLKSSLITYSQCNERVSNSLATDEDGGIYVATSKHMYRFQWTGTELFTKWVASYKTSDQQFAGRLGVGTGTTPTLMGVGDQDKLVVIGDGQRLNHLVLFWRDEIPADWVPLPGSDPRTAAEVPMTFGNPHSQRSSTEQSVLVSGYGAAVVSNDYGQIRRHPRTLGTSNWMRILFSGDNRIAPHGVERFTWDPQTRTMSSTWANRCMSCPNAIPCMSRATQTMYFIGNRNETWTLEGVNWNTGQSEFCLPLGKRQKFNSFYAGTQIGLDGDIISGSLTGLLRISSE